MHYNLFPKSSAKYFHTFENRIDSEIENLIIDSKITKSTGDDPCKNENKRKRKKEFFDNYVQQYYFYDHLLK